MLQLQYIGVWGLCYIQMKRLFLFNSCLNIVQIMEYFMEQNKLLLASFFHTSGYQMLLYLYPRHLFQGGVWGVV